MPHPISIQLVRNATVVFHYGDKKLLIDPMLADKGAYPALPGTPNTHLRNPLVGLPVAASSLLDADAVLVTHLHRDHWDAAAIAMLPKHKPLFCQNEADALAIRAAGFTDVQVLDGNTGPGDLVVRRTECQHGSDEAYANPQVAAILGEASGLYFSRPGEPSVYFAGDTIWTDTVASNLEGMRPDIVVLNGGDAQLDGYGAIIMGKEDVARVRALLPDATIVVIHMEALNHCVLSRAALRDYIAEKGIGNVIVPEDGEVVVF